MNRQHSWFIEPDECADIRRRRRNGAMVSHLADEYDTSDTTITSHATGQCSHEVDTAPVNLEAPTWTPIGLLEVLRNTDERFLTTDEVCRRVGHDVESRATVREALLDLAEDGAVDYKRVQRAFTWWVSDDTTGMT